MRRTLIGLMAAGALLVAGCGGDDGETTSADGGDGGGGENASASDFCAQFQGYDEQFNQNPDASEEEVVEAIRSLNPPEEIADDYETLLQGLDALMGVDPSDPEAAAAAQEEMAQYQQASENIQAYVDENCEGGSTDDSSEDGAGSEVTTGESVPTTGG
jgi:hypothetical protein